MGIYSRTLFFILGFSVKVCETKLVRKMQNLVTWKWICIYSSAKTQVASIPQSSSSI